MMNLGFFSCQVFCFNIGSPGKGSKYWEFPDLSGHITCMRTWIGLLLLPALEGNKILKSPLSGQSQLSSFIFGITWLSLIGSIIESGSPAESIDRLLATVSSIALIAMTSQSLFSTNCDILNLWVSLSLCIVLLAVFMLFNFVLFC